MSKNRKAYDDEYYKVLSLFEEYTSSKLDDDISAMDLAEKTMRDRRREPGKKEKPEKNLLDGFYKWLQMEKNYTCEESFRNLKRMANFLNNNLTSRLINHCYVLKCSDCYWGGGRDRF